MSASDAPESAEAQSQISSRLHLSRQTLNSAFMQLRERGRVSLEPYEGCQRSERAVLTERGRAFVEQNVLQMYRAEKRSWQRMDEDEQDTLTKLIRKFSNSIRSELDSVSANSQ